MDKSFVIDFFSFHFHVLNMTFEFMHNNHQGTPRTPPTKIARITLLYSFSLNFHILNMIIEVIQVM